MTGSRKKEVWVWLAVVAVVLIAMCLLRNRVVTIIGGVVVVIGLARWCWLWRMQRGQG